jgi:Fe-S cluster biogenesis protein NfuA
MSDETLHPASVELETQLRRLETIVDPASRSTATDLVASVLRFHTAALERMLELINGNDNKGPILEGFDRDPLIRSVLLVHDLHPQTLATRVQRAIADVEPTLRKRGARVELIEADEERVLVRISGGEPGRGTFAPAVEKVIRSSVPEAVNIIVEDTAAPAPASGFVPLEKLGHAEAASFAISTQK